MGVGGLEASHGVSPSWQPVSTVFWTFVRAGTHFVGVLGNHGEVGPVSMNVPNDLIVDSIGKTR